MPGDVRVARLCLDINVFYADLLGRTKRITPSACSDLVEMAMAGAMNDLGVQLVISVPMTEQWASVLRRHFGYSGDDAWRQAWLLDQVARDGPAHMAPLVVVGSEFVPFATERETALAAEAHRVASHGIVGGTPPPLFDAVTDDRHVYLAAVAGRADILVTTNLRDFEVPGSILFEREDVFIAPLVDRALVIARPSYAAHWLRRGVVPDWRFIRDHGEDFRPREAGGVRGA